MKDFLKAIGFLSSAILVSAVISPFFAGAVMWVNRYIPLHLYVDYFDAILKFMGVQ